MHGSNRGGGTIGRSGRDSTASPASHWLPMRFLSRWPTRRWPACRHARILYWFWGELHNSGECLPAPSLPVGRAPRRSPALPGDSVVGMFRWRLSAGRVPWQTRSRRSASDRGEFLARAHSVTRYAASRNDSFSTTFEHTLLNRVSLSLVDAGRRRLDHEGAKVHEGAKHEGR